MRDFKFILSALRATIWCVFVTVCLSLEDVDPQDKLIYVARRGTDYSTLHREDEAHLRIGYIQVGALLQATPRNNDTIILRGPLAAFIRECMKLMNSTALFYAAMDNSWGFRQKNGSFNGLVGMLQRKEIGIALFPFSPTPDRLEIAYFSHYISVAVQAILSRPKDLEPAVFKEYGALGWKVWIGFGLSILVVTFLLMILINKKPHIIGFMRECWKALSVLLDQDTKMDQNEDMQAVRVLYGVWFLVAAVFIHAFRGQLLSTLLLKTPQMLIDSPKDFLRFKKITPCIIAGGFAGAYFKNSASPEITEIRRRAQTMKTIFANASIVGMPNLQRVLDGTHAVIFNKFITQYTVRNFPPGSIRFSKEELQFGIQSLLLRKDFSEEFYRQLYVRISWIIQSGLMIHWKDLHARGFQDKLSLDDRNVRDLRMEDVQGVFLSLLCGYSLSVGSFAAEMIFFRCRKLWQRFSNNNKNIAKSRSTLTRITH